MANIESQFFKDIDLSDEFFNSLKLDYKEFTEWFNRKADEGKHTFTLYENDKLMAFLYLKIENDVDKSISPVLE